MFQSSDIEPRLQIYKNVCYMIENHLSVTLFIINFMYIKLICIFTKFYLLQYLKAELWIPYSHILKHVLQVTKSLKSDSIQI